MKNRDRANCFALLFAFSVALTAHGQSTANEAKEQRTPLHIRPMLTPEVKKGDPVFIRWYGARSVSKFKVDLIQHGKVVQTLASRADNTGKFVWQTSKIGRDLAIRLTDSTNNIVATSARFRVRPKVRFVVKALPVIAAGVAIYLLQPKPLTELPAPVDPN